MTEVQKFKKNNKQRRLVIAAKAGFATVELYIAHLENAPKAKKVSKKAVKKNVIPTIHIVDVADASASMAYGKIEALNFGIEQQLEELKKVNNINYTYTLLEFSGKNHMRFIHLMTPIKDVRHQQVDTYNSTALYKAIGLALDTITGKMNREDKVLVKIYTDGGENDSKGTKYSSLEVVAARIAKAEREGFTVTLVGTTIDVKNIIKTLKIDASNTLTYDGTGKGLGETFTMGLAATQAFSSKVLRKEDVKVGFYKQTGKL